MDSFGSSPPSGGNAVMKRRRSATVRRPRSDAQLVLESREMSSPSPTPSFSNSRRFSPDDTEGSDTSFRRKEVYLNNLTQRSSSIDASFSKKYKKDGKMSEELNGYYGTSNSRSGHGPELKHCNEGVLAPARSKHLGKVKEGNAEMQSNYVDGNTARGSAERGMQKTSVSGVNMENKPTKVKFKIGGVTRTVNANSDMDTSAGRAAAKPPRPLDASHHRPKLVSQDNGDHHSSSERMNNLHKHSWQDSNFSHRKREDSRGVMIETVSGKQSEQLNGLTQLSEPTRKSKRIPKKRVFDDDEGDDEIRYLEKLKTSKVIVDHMGEGGENDERAIKKHKLSKLSKNRNATYEMDEDFILRSSRENRRRMRSGKETEDIDYSEDDEPISDGTPEAKKKKQKSIIDPVSEIRTEPLTTRQRALQSGKSGNGESLIEFPDGLPPQPSRKSKEQLTDVEKLAKKAEAAQRRKLQVEKQAKESEASAIRKILGHDSDRRKEEKKQRELEEKAKAAESRILKPGTIRWVQGPNGTNLTFAEDIGLPSILCSKPCSYPAPREKCAGPSCMNPYKYRDSKSKLPLCSLQCYKAIQGRQTEQFAT